MFAGLMRGWAERRYRKEAMQLVSHLRTLDNESVGLLLAISMHHRNAISGTGTDLHDLAGVAAAAPMYQHELAKAVNVLAREKRFQDSMGLQVWVHSLRAARDRNLHDVGRDIWRELARGLPHVAKARDMVRKETGFDLDVSNAELPRLFS